jgi:nickel superoxide dismutase
MGKLTGEDPLIRHFTATLIGFKQLPTDIFDTTRNTKGGKMKHLAISLTLIAALILLWSSVAAAHCEIPCGIYDDQMRIRLIAEDITTVEKAMKRIGDLSNEKSVNYNQLVRWISNKEEHATRIQHTVTQYFMTQRIKPDQEKYTEKVTLLHQMLIAAMKCKQTTDLEHVVTLRMLLKKFETLYFGAH